MRGTRVRPTPSPTPPTPTPKPTPAFKPVVLIAGGTGTVNAPTGESPAVLDAAQIYDPAARKFVLDQSDDNASRPSRRGDST